MTDKTKIYHGVKGERISSGKKIMPRSVMYERQKVVDILFFIILLIIAASLVNIFLGTVI